MKIIHRLREKGSTALRSGFTPERVFRRAKRGGKTEAFTGNTAFLID
ncbi:MAG: hypothetical protein M3T96_06550 [Acidobacteriota bacterium]|nr:hypothetical protein [Acidobacteriota bacterium]